MTSYEEILESTKRLSSVEFAVGDALLAEELGFGMWRARKMLRTPDDFLEKVKQ